MAASLALTPDLPLPPTQHVAIFGQTGSGKTTLGQYLLSSRDYVLVIDTKHQLSWPGFKVASKASTILKAPGRWIFRPPDWWFRNDPAPRWGDFLTAVMRQGGWYVYIDEGHDFGMGISGQEILQEINRFMVKGRSFGITVWFGSQRPRWVPTFVLSESSHMIAFFLKNRADREYIGEYMVRDGKGDPLYQRIVLWREPVHGFFYSRSSDGLCVPFKPLDPGLIAAAKREPARPRVVALA